MKIILKSDRKLTDEEIIRFSRNKLILETVTSSHRGYDKFAGVSLPDRVTGKEDYISALSCRIEESLDKENEYIIFIEQTEEILGLPREYTGGRFGRYVLANFYNQLEYLQTTQLMELFDENEIRKQLENIYKADGNPRFLAEEKLVDEIMDILSEMNLREAAYSVNEKDEVCSFVKSDLVDPLSRNKKYQLIKFPCKILVKLEMDGHFKFVKCVENDKQENRDMNEILKEAETIYSLLSVLSEYERYVASYYFVMPQEICSEEEIEKGIKGLELIQARTKDIDDFSFEQVASLLDKAEQDAFIKKYFDTHNVEQMIEKIKEIGDGKLLKDVLKIFSKHIDGREITSQQSDVIKEILLDTLNSNDGWKDNAKILSGVVDNIASSLTIDEKIQLLQASIDSHTRKCLADEYNEYRHEEYKMEISELINHLFSSEEQVTLIDELLKQKNYQAMVLIINQCRYDEMFDSMGLKINMNKYQRNKKIKFQKHLLTVGKINI